MRNLQYKIKNSIKTEFVRNSLTLISGTTIAQLIAILTTPILSRIYTTEDFGVLSVYMSICSLLAVVSTLRYEMAVILPKKEKDAINVIALSFIISLFWSIISFIAIIIFGSLIHKYINYPQANGFLYFVPLVVIFIGLTQVLNFWSIRLKKFKNNAIARVGYTVSNSSISLVVGLVKQGPLGLILGYFLSQIVTVSILGASLIEKVKLYKKEISIKRIKLNAKRYISFPKINLAHALVDSFQDNGIIFFMKDFFGNSVLGSYSFAYRLLKVPTGIISGAISQVFLEKASKAVNNGENIKPMLIKIYSSVFIIGFPFFLFLFIFAPSIFAFVFSEAYRESGEIARILIPWLFLNFVANSASGIPLIYNKLKIPFLFTCIDICLKILSLFIGWYYGSYKVSFICISVSSSILMLISFIWVFSVVNKNMNNSKIYG